MARPRIEYIYTTEAKHQKNNPFCLMEQKERFRSDLARRLGWITQRHQSTVTLEREFWEAMMEPHKMFGRSSENHCLNTGISALGGALEKLTHGDLSQKQLNNIKPVLEAMNKLFPDLWSEIVFIERKQDNDKPSTGLFEF